MGLEPEAVERGESLVRAAAEAQTPAHDDADLDEAVKVVARAADILGRSMFLWKTLGEDRLVRQASSARRVNVNPCPDSYRGGDAKAHSPGDPGTLLHHLTRHDP